MNTITKWGVGIFIWLFISAPLPTFAQVIQPINGLAVFDDNGERLGPVVGVWSQQTPPSQNEFSGGGVVQHEGQ